MLPLRWSRSRSRQKDSPQRQDSPALSVIKSDSPLPSDFKGLWDAAYKSYQYSLERDLRQKSIAITDELKDLETPDDILRVLSTKLTLLSDDRKGSAKSQAIRTLIKPIVRGLSVVLETAGETASAAVRVAWLHTLMALLDGRDAGCSGRKGHIRCCRCATKGESGRALTWLRTKRHRNIGCRRHDYDI